MNDSGESERHSDLIERLDVLIRLQAHTLVAHVEGQKEKTLRLHNAGLKPKVIAEVLGTSANSVSVTLSKSRKGGSAPQDG
ncbi:MAG TPA: hypothetical protein VG841_07065 [Caulobacterales bacterium]|nr:hypothetical protein [Caulobacterales bacterium]